MRCSCNRSIVILCQALCNVQGRLLEHYMAFYQNCSLSVLTVFQLVKQVSKSTCELGKTFGIQNGVLWVDDGCRGQFDVCACSEIRQVNCDSWSFKYAACSIEDVDAVLNVKVNNKRSDSECVLGSSFGFKGGSIWVDKGCRASFDVCI